MTGRSSFGHRPTRHPAGRRAIGVLISCLSTASAGQADVDVAGLADVAGKEVRCAVYAGYFASQKRSALHLSQAVSVAHLLRDQFDGCYQKRLPSVAAQDWALIGPSFGLGPEFCVGRQFERPKAAFQSKVGRPLRYADYDQHLAESKDLAQRYYGDEACEAGIPNQ